MAQFKESALSQGLTGKVGGVYLRKQNGKTVVCSLPAQYTLPMDEISVKRRVTMQHVMNFSKIVTKDPVLYPIWKKSPLKGVAGYHKCVGFNYPKKGTDFCLENLKLSPLSQEIFVQVKEASFSNRTFSITLNPLGDDSGINYARETFITAGGFAMLSNGLPEETEDVVTVPLKRMNLPANPQSELNFLLKNYTPDIDLFDSSKNVTVFVIFSTLNSEEQPVKHSKTFVFRY